MRYKAHPTINLILSITLLSISAANAAAEDTILTVPVDKLPYAATPEGVEFAALIGDRFTEPSMTMVKLPKGLVSPAHIKSANMFGVMISGAMTHTAVGADLAEEVVLASGSFYKIPGGVAHVSKCVSDVDCVTFLYQDGPFDFQAIDQ